jgi:hypothetical protein
MALLDAILRNRRRRRQPRTEPQTAGEAFFISLIKAIGRALGGRFGRALSGPKPRRRRRFW